MRKIVILLLIMIVSSVPAKTRWTTTRFTPSADIIGAGQFVANYNIFLNTEFGRGLTGYSIGGLTMGASEWVEVNLGYTGGINLGFKGRLLNEYGMNGAPSLAIGVRNIFNNEARARSRLETGDKDFTGEYFLVVGKSANAFNTRFHGGVMTIPDSRRDKFNGFIAMEQGIGSDFIFTLEGFTQQKNFYLALTTTIRFGENNNAEFYFSLLDLEGIFFSDRKDLGITLTPKSRQDWIKPGIVVGTSIAWGGRRKFRDGRFALRAMEDVLAIHETRINELSSQIDTLKIENEALRERNEKAFNSVDSLLISWAMHEAMRDTLPPHFTEVFSRLVAYTQAYAATRFDPFEVIRILDEAGEEIIAQIARNERGRGDIRLRAITMLGELRARYEIPVLLDILEFTIDNREKIEVISSLGKINDRTVEPRIRDFVHHQDENLRIAATEVLDMWSRNPISPTLWTLPIPAVSGQNNANSVQNQENTASDRNNDVFLVEPIEENE
jgi:hypothetical protein